MESIARDRCTYLLPIRRAAFDEAETRGLADYFHVLREAGCDVIVIDGSPQAVFRSHGRCWAGVCRHEAVARHFGFLNDKVNGILTGIALASTEDIILADDDIRYEPAQIQEICDRLQAHEVVRPQNFLRPLPWWAAMEAGRMLINRAVLRTADYPGTCAFRREAACRAGYYDGDVLFDNEEMIRHFAAEGLTIDYANDLFVRKNAPPFRKWLEQRPRQAYEDFPLRAKTAIFGSILPVALCFQLVSGRRAMAAYIAAVAMIAAGLAMRGRNKGKARKYFRAFAILCAPLWVLERATSTYWALGWRVFRGGYPFGDRVLRKGVGRDWFVGRPANCLSNPKGGLESRARSARRAQRSVLSAV
ncbi:MAG: glycosyltransferase family 2 protein [Verrucomicrobia bacterium]|nr:glycosyltransferase family 2 protein [Verrucomicrobiota bacterium]